MQVGIAFCSAMRVLLKPRQTVTQLDSFKATQRLYSRVFETEPDVCYYDHGSKPMWTQRGDGSLSSRCKFPLKNASRSQQITRWKSSTSTPSLSAVSIM